MPESFDYISPMMSMPWVGYHRLTLSVDQRRSYVDTYDVSWQVVQWQTYMALKVKVNPIMWTIWGNGLLLDYSKSVSFIILIELVMLMN